MRRRRWCGVADLPTSMGRYRVVCQRRAHWFGRHRGMTPDGVIRWRHR